MHNPYEDLIYDEGIVFRSHTGLQVKIEGPDYFTIWDGETCKGDLEVIWADGPEHVVGAVSSALPGSKYKKRGVGTAPLRVVFSTACSMLLQHEEEMKPKPKPKPKPIPTPKPKPKLEIVNPDRPRWRAFQKLDENKQRRIKEAAFEINPLVESLVLYFFDDSEKKVVWWVADRENKKEEILLDRMSFACESWNIAEEIMGAVFKGFASYKLEV